MKRYKAGSKSSVVSSVTLAVSAGRVGLGVLMFARPRLLPSLLGVDAGSAARAGWLARMVGGREIALGGGTLLAGRGGGSPRPWLLAQATGDGGDALALTLAWRRGNVGGLPAAVVIASAAAGAAAEVFAAARSA